MVITHNMKNKKLLLGIAWAWLICLSANAEVKLPAFFSDGMVMQQQTRANLWGTATPNASVTITTSWDKQTYYCRCKRRVETCFIHPLCRRSLHDYF